MGTPVIRRESHTSYSLPARIVPETTGLYGLGLMVFAVVIVLTLLLLTSDFSQDIPYLYLVPWLLLLLVVYFISTFFIFKIGEGSLVNPLVFATWGFFFPGFVVGGFSLALGFSRPYFLSLIQDPATSLPWTVVLVIIGYSALSIGYFLPVGKWVGRFVDERLARFPEVDPVGSTFPVFILLAIGMIHTWITILFGPLLAGENGEGQYNGLVSITSKLAVEATFVLWFMIFRRPKFSFTSFMLVGALASVDLLGIVFSESRAAIVGTVALITFAYILSGRELKRKQLILIFSSGCLALVIGMVYGSLVRQASSESQGTGIEARISYAQQAFDKLGGNNSGESLLFGLNILTERIDELSQLAVVVSTHEQLAPYEEIYGLDDNIRKDLLTNLIPRIVWNDKPIPSDAHVYGALYFEYGENSFSVTPIGDLLRNYGVGGVFIGMLVLGILLRILYCSFIKNQKPSLLRATLYFMLLTSINYEYFYGVIFPFMCKVGFTAVIGLVFIRVLSNRLKGSPFSDRSIKLESLS